MCSHHDDSSQTNASSDPGYSGKVFQICPISGQTQQFLFPQFASKGLCSDLDYPDLESLVPQPLQSVEILNDDDDDLNDDDSELRAENNEVQLPFIGFDPAEIQSDIFRTHPGRQKCGHSWGDLVIGESGTIESPNYPNHYPSNISCVWRLQAPQLSIIELTCTHVETEDCTPSNLKDYLLFNPNTEKDEYFL